MSGQTDFSVPNWWRGITQPIPLVVLGAITVGCIVAGPFGSIEAPVAWRALYWVPLNAVALVLSSFVFMYADTSRSLSAWPLAVRVGLAALTFTVPFTVIAATGAGLVFGTDLDVVSLGGSVLLIAIVIRFVVGLFQASMGGEAAPAPSPQTAPIWKRVPPKLGRELVRLKVQDHYVEIHTTLGMELVLMRFSDAIGELRGIEGHQTHRSHWVATGSVAEAYRRDGKTLLRLTDGTEVPVSRTYQPKLREAGLV